MGPCRITKNKGVCGASAELIASRNLLRTVASGTACHTDHAREVALALLKTKKVKDKDKLKQLAKKLKTNKVALEALEDFRRQEGLYHKKEGNFLNWVKINAPKDRIKKWKELNILPVNADMETSHALHQTTMGNDADYKNILLSALRLGITDGYAGMHMASNFQDILFGTPTITKSETDLGTLKEDCINIIVHGHIPLLSESIIKAAKKLNNKAKKLGAKGINIIGMCCTGNEVLMRLGIPQAGHIMQQEAAIVTGLTDAIVVDIQCIFPSLSDLAQCYHTELITTIDYVRMPNSTHIPFTLENAKNSSRKIVLKAIEAYKKRNPSKINPINKKTTTYAGFSTEAIIKKLSTLGSPKKVIKQNIKNKNIYGIVALIGCRNPKTPNFHEQLTKLLIKNNILVIGTGCWAHVAGQSGLMTPEANKLAGKKLRKLLNRLEIPPCLHMGSCVDNSRIDTLFNFLSKSLNLPYHKLPVIVSAPEYATEKAAAIALFFLALGINTHINPIPPITGSKKVTSFLTKEMEKVIDSRVLIATTPKKAAKVIIKEIKKKRKYL